MSNVNCNAKDPSSCRYHRPDAGTLAKAALDNAKAALADVEAKYADSDEIGNEYYDARWNVDRAEEAYYGTAMGIADITKQMENEPDDNERFVLEMKLAQAKYELADAERQNAINERNGGPLIPAGNHTYAEPKIVSGGDALWPTSTGAKYDPTLRASQVKSLVNADFKEAMKKGYLPKHLKIAVRSRSNTLEVRIIGAADEQVYNDPDNLRYNDFTKQGRELLQRVQGIVSNYQRSQYDSIEGRTNSINFWDNVGYETGWEKSLREDKETEAAARKAAKQTATKKAA